MLGTDSKQIANRPASRRARGGDVNPGRSRDLRRNFAHLSLPAVRDFLRAGVRRLPPDRRQTAHAETDTDAGAGCGSSCGSGANAVAPLRTLK